MLVGVGSEREKDRQDKSVLTMQYKLLLIVIAIMLCITIEVTQSSTEQMYNDLRNFVIQDGLISIDQVEGEGHSLYYVLK